MTINEVAKTYFGLDPVTLRTKDENKLKKQREKFGGVCPVCKQPLTFIPGTNVLACKNEKCKGRERTVTNKDGETKKVYTPVTRLLDAEGAKIGRTLFDE